MARIDDAVTRILRVKLRAGLFDQPRPSEREHAGDPDALDHGALARKAVRKSLVLLKNKGTLLPLQSSAKVLVVGKSADTLPNQTGGWSLTWQGTGNSNADFPNGTTILARPARGAGRRERHVRRGRRRRRPVAVRRGRRRDRRDAVRRGRRRHRPPLARGGAAVPGRPRDARPRERQGRARGDRVRVGPPALREQGAQPLRRVRGGLAARHRGPAAWPTCWSRVRGRAPASPASSPTAGPARRARRRSTSATRSTRRCSPTATASATGRPGTSGPCRRSPSRAASTRAAAGPPPRTWSCSTASIRTRTSPTSARRSTGAARSSATTRAP